MAARQVRIGAQKKALAALRQDTQRRASLVGAAAETQDRIHALIGELTGAFDDHATAFAAAMQAGWSKGQLEELGVQEDPAGSARRALRRVVQPASQDGPGNAGPSVASTEPAAPAAAAAAAQ